MREMLSILYNFHAKIVQNNKKCPSLSTILTFLQEKKVVLLCFLQTFPYICPRNLIKRLLIIHSIYLT